MTEKRMSKAKIKKLAILLATVVLLCAYVYSFFTVNNKYPQNEKEIYTYGQPFYHRGVEMKILKTEYFDGTELNRDNDFKDAMYLSAEEDITDIYKLMILDVDFYTPTTKLSV